MQFQWNATTYHRNSQFQYDHALEAISNHAFNADHHILDVGCGDGKITCHIASNVPNGQVVGIDNAPSMIAFAQSKYKAPNIQFMVESAEAFHFENQFDLIVSFACLHWVKDQDAFLRNAKKALKTNGKMILNLYPQHPLIWGAIHDTVHAPHWFSYFLNYINPHIHYDKKTYTQHVLNANLTIISIKEEIPVATFKSPKEAELFIRSWLPHTELLEEEMKEPFIHEIIERYLTISSHHKGNKVEIPFLRLDMCLCH